MKPVPAIETFTVRAREAVDDAAPPALAAISQESLNPDEDRLTIENIGVRATTVTATLKTILEQRPKPATDLELGNP